MQYMQCEGPGQNGNMELSNDSFKASSPGSFFFSLRRQGQNPGDEVGLLLDNITVCPACAGLA